MRKKIFANKSIHFVAALGAGVLLGAFLAIFSLINVDARTSAASVYPKNEAGQTYGSEKLATSFETGPDLIAAVGTDGTRGYVKATIYTGNYPKHRKKPCRNKSSIQARHPVGFRFMRKTA